MADKNVVLWAVRHGTTELNADNCFRGKANPSLDEKGRKDAEVARDFLKDKFIGDVYSSPKLRTTQTAETIGLPYTTVDDLMALNVGDFSGKPKNKENTDAINYYIDHPDEKIPGGESLNQFRSRVRPLFNEAIQRFEQTGFPCLFIVHSSIIHELGQVFNDDHHSSRVKPGGIASLVWDESGLHAEPTFKPLKISKNKADTIS